MEIQREYDETYKKTLNKLRSRIVDLLNRSGEVTGISDMFKEAPEFRLNPIMFVMHLPVSLQKFQAEEPDRAVVEDFLVIYDGTILMVCAACSSEERPMGVYDVRDRFLSMMKSIVHGLEMTPPCLTHKAIVYANQPEEVRKSYPGDIYVKMNSKETFFNALQSLYMRIIDEMESFYEACYTCEKTIKTVEEINKHESNLIVSLREFLATTWRKPIKRTKVVSQMKTHSVNILDKLSEYSSLTRELKEDLSLVEEARAHNSLFGKFIDNVVLDEYTKPETVDTDSLIRVIEHVRSETESYGSFVSSFISTLVGAIIGSALTILVSYLLGFL